MSRRNVNEVSIINTGQLPYEIRVVAGSVYEEVIATAVCPYVGMEAINAFGFAVMHAAPWFGRSYAPRFEVWQGDELKWTACDKGRYDSETELEKLVP